MFHSDYKHIIDRLPESLVKRACERLLHHSKDPIPLESISRKSERIESYLRHTLEVYENSLNKKKRKLWPRKNYCAHEAGQNVMYSLHHWLYMLLTLESKQMAPSQRH